MKKKRFKPEENRLKRIEKQWKNLDNERTQGSNNNDRKRKDK